MSIGHDGILGRILDDPARRAATALVDGPRSLTFGELRRAALAIAHALRARGVRRQDRIVIVGPHSAEQVALVLAASALGAVFVPLDPELPELRLRALLGEVRPRLIASPTPIGAYGSGTSWLPWRSLESGLESARNACELPALDTGSSPRASDVAYMLFTSGTTGRPKAVQIEHGALRAFFESYNLALGIGPGDRCLNTGAFHFDVCLLDLFLPLYFGATVYLGPRLPLPALFLGALSRHRITHFYAVGTWLSQITADGSVLDAYDLHALRLLQTGAEVCKPTVVNQWLQRLPRLRFVNSYGPTEVSVGCLQFAKLTPGPLQTQHCPIGKPHVGTRVKLMGPGQRVIDAPYAAGELLLGGRQLMRGYWNAAERTREAFVILEGERYYRSGDMAYRDADGDYWFVGRMDDQIKFLGHRFHLREVQDALALHPRVCGAVAGLVADSRGLEHLAVIGEVLEPITPALAHALRAHLRRHLPRYMLPAVLGLLGSWPRATSGKADARGCLSELAQAVALGGCGAYVRRRAGFAPLIEPPARARLHTESPRS